jgi:hypothetical protein
LQRTQLAETLGKVGAGFLVIQPKDEPMPKLIGADDEDNKSWKPVKEKGANDKVPQSRDMSRAIEKESNRRKNGSC